MISLLYTVTYKQVYIDLNFCIIGQMQIDRSIAFVFLQSIIHVVDDSQAKTTPLIIPYQTFTYDILLFIKVVP